MSEIAQNKAEDASPKAENISEFLLGAPPYAEYAAASAFVRDLYGRGITDKFDGYCPRCKKDTTYTLSHVFIREDLWPKIEQRVAFEKITIQCARDEAHVVHYWILLSKMRVLKVGQFPSLADIANDEVAPYRAGMTKIDGREFHKAIGLAAHGVGVGSFVYLRRVFERMIFRRFLEFKITEGWDEEKFAQMRMQEKVQFLKGHLPDFLVENAKIYSILSLGIHELDEDDCLRHFDVLKNSIFMILDDDKKKRDELAMRKKLNEAISAIASDKKS